MKKVTKRKKPMKILDLVKAMMLLEGGKSQVKRGDMIQTLGLLGMVMARDERAGKTLLQNGRKRWARRKGNW